MQGRWKYMIAVARGEDIDWLFAASSSMSENIHAKIITIAESQLPYIFILHLYELDTSNNKCSHITFVKELNSYSKYIA